MRRVNIEMKGDDAHEFARLSRLGGHAGRTAWWLFGATFAHYTYAPAEVVWASGGLLALAALVWAYFDVRLHVILKRCEK